MVLKFDFASQSLDEKVRMLEQLAFRYSAILAIALISSACNTTGSPARTEAPADSVAGETAFELAGPGGAALLVPVFINGEGPFQFVLDTGATFTCVDQSLTRQLSLAEARGVMGAGATVGGSGRMRILQVDSVRVGAARAMDLLVCELDLQHTSQIGVEIQGLVGLNFLKLYRVTLDFDRNILLLQDGQAGR